MRQFKVVQKELFLNPGFWTLKEYEGLKYVHVPSIGAFITIQPGEIRQWPVIERKIILGLSE